jgi:hypothetical protein
MIYASGEIGGKKYTDQERIGLKDLLEGLIKDGSISSDFFDLKRGQWIFNLIYTKKQGESNEPARNYPLEITLETKSGQIVLRYTAENRRKDKDGNWKYNENKIRLQASYFTDNTELAFFLLLHSSHENSPLRDKQATASYRFFEPEKARAANAQRVISKFDTYNRIQNDDDDTIKTKYFGLGYAFSDKQTAADMRLILITRLDEIGSDAFLEKYDDNTNLVAGILAKAYHYAIIVRSDSGSVQSLSWGNGSPKDLRGVMICQIPQGQDAVFFIRQFFIDRQESIYQTLLKLINDRDNSKSIEMAAIRTQKMATENTGIAIENVDVKKVEDVVKFALSTQMLFPNLIDKKIYCILADGKSSALIDYDPKSSSDATVKLIAEYLKKNDKEKDVVSFLSLVKKNLSNSAKNS